MTGVGRATRRRLVAIAVAAFGMGLALSQAGGAAIADFYDFRELTVIYGLSIALIGLAAVIAISRDDTGGN